MHLGAEHHLVVRGLFDDLLEAFLGVGLLVHLLVKLAEDEVEARLELALGMGGNGVVEVVNSLLAVAVGGGQMVLGLGGVEEDVEFLVLLVGGQVVQVL